MTAAIPVRCNGFCVAGGRVRRVTWFCPSTGPVDRVIHSADGYWLACQVAPEGSTRSQIWVVTTDPDDRMARRIDFHDAGMAELVGVGRHPGGRDADGRRRRRLSPA